MSTGVVKIDGSSTVFPITEAVAEKFGAVNPNIRVPVGVSGTGGGFAKFIAQETDINYMHQEQIQVHLIISQKRLMVKVERLDQILQGVKMIMNWFKE